MMRHVVQYGVVGVLAGLFVVSAGCSAHGNSATQIRLQTVCSAELDDYREIRLTCDRLVDREAGKPERTYELMRVVVRPRPAIVFEETVQKVELKLGERHGQCRFEDVEARRDEAGRRVWFVERGSARILATIDLVTRATTGPDDEPPAWATPDGGERLE